MTKELTQTISWNTTKWLPEERTELEKEFGYISILIAQNGGVIPGKYSTKHKRFFDWDRMLKLDPTLEIKKNGQPYEVL